MAISGNLKTMALADLLQWVSVAESTGTLVVTERGVSKSLYFRRGQVISCTSSDPKELLGHFLVSRGLIGEEQLAAAVAEQERTGELLGAVLVRGGAISRENLMRALEVKAEESIYELFGWQEGRFRFVDGELPDHELVPVSLDVTGLVLEGMRRLDEWARIHEHIPSMYCVPVAVGDLLEGENEDARRAVLELVNDDRSVEEIRLETHSSEFFVCDILSSKIRAGKLKAVRPRMLAGIDADAGATSERLLEQARAHLSNGQLEHALRRLRAARALEPDDPDVAAQTRELEDQIRASLEPAGIHLESVPVLARPLAELSAASLSPEEGFVLSRINGLSDLSSIVKISPLPEIDALLVVWKLVEAGHVRLTRV